MKKALITGITGQDGSYLSELLLSKGYEVFGFVRRTSSTPFRYIEDLINKKKIKILYGNLRDISALDRAMEEVCPDEVYNLAAQSHVGISFKCAEETHEINHYGVGRVVNAALKANPNVRIYQASTSEMFGASPPKQNENTPLKPVSPYAEAKTKAHRDFVLNYRNQHNAFVVSGILFNHESPRRGENFVTRKITISLAKIKKGLQDVLELGNLDAVRDWGFAGDYVVAMWHMLQQDKPDDFVIATGVEHSVRDFVNAAAKELDIHITWEGKGINEIGRDQNGKIIVRVNSEFFRPQETNALIGDSAKAKKILGWQPKTSFKELVAMMVRADYDRLV